MTGVGDSCECHVTGGEDSCECHVTGDEDSCECHVTGGEDSAAISFIFVHTAGWIQLLGVAMVTTLLYQSHADGSSVSPSALPPRWAWL